MADVDVMAFGAHPDDIEIGCGGTLIKLADMGYSIVLVDMTRGELGTRGTVETRMTEAAGAVKIIGAIARENLALEDGDIHTTREAKRKVVEVVRRYRPHLVFLPYYEDRHPDHYHTSQLAYEGVFLSGLGQYETGQESYRPLRVLYYQGRCAFEPTFTVDITGQFERKMQAIYAFSTQFQPNDTFYREAGLTYQDPTWAFTHRAAYHGALIGKRYGEAFLVRGRLEVKDPMQLTFSSF